MECSMDTHSQLVIRSDLVIVLARPPSPSDPLQQIVCCQQQARDEIVFNIEMDPVG